MEKNKLNFGLFNHVEYKDFMQIGEIFENELNAIRYTDNLNSFYVYFIAEHFFTPLTVNQSIGITLSAGFRVTNKLRLGPLGYVTSVRNPMHLAIEICMLDNLSKGRLEVGFTSGVSHAELIDLGLNPKEAREKAKEITSIILEYLKSASKNEPISFSGKYFKYENVEPVIKPYQYPHPPIWIPTTNIKTMPWAAENEFNVATVFYSREKAKKLFDTHKEEFLKIKKKEIKDIPRLAIVREVYISQSSSIDREKEELRKQLNVFAKRLVYAPEKKGLLDPRDISKAFHGVISEGAGPIDILDLLNVETAIKSGLVLFGDSETIAKEIVNEFKSTGINFFIAHLNFGNISYEKYLDELRIFAKEVIPRVNEMLKEE